MPPPPPSARDLTVPGGAPLALGKNEPNPFWGETQIRYEVSRSGPVRLRVYDLLGRHVETLVDATLQPGFHTAVFDGAPHVAGTYLYRLEIPSGTLARRMTLMTWPAR